MSKRLSIALPVALSISLLMATDSFAQKLTKRPSSTVEIGSGTAPAGGAIPAPTEGRLPVLGDVLRVGCFSPQYQEGRIGEGVFEGAVGGLLLLRQSRSVGVPVENVRRVEIRERRSHKGLGRVVGAFLGALVGGGHGGSYYDPENSSLHYPKSFFVTTGAILGGVVGVSAGQGIGSLIGTDTWLETPPDWVVQHSGSGRARPEALAQFALGCRSLDTDAR